MRLRAITATGPEHLFGYRPLRADGIRIAGEMPTGPWLAGPGGVAGPGALAVLVDNVLGHAIIADRPDGQRSVSTEIGIDLIATIPLDGSPVRAHARTVDADESGGLATGEVVDAAGNIIARCRQRGRFLADAEQTATPDDSPARETSKANGLSALIGSVATLVEDGDSLTVVSTAALANPFGILHGGITFALADWLGVRALASAALSSVSVHVAYARPIPAGEQVRFTAEVVHSGRSLGVSRVVGRDESGKACTFATVTAH